MHGTHPLYWFCYRSVWLREEQSSRLQPASTEGSIVHITLLLLLVVVVVVVVVVVTHVFMHLFLNILINETGSQTK